MHSSFSSAGNASDETQPWDCMAPELPGLMPGHEPTAEVLPKDAAPPEAAVPPKSAEPPKSAVPPETAAPPETAEAEPLESFTESNSEAGGSFHVFYSSNIFSVFTNSPM